MDRKKKEKNKNGREERERNKVEDKGAKWSIRL